MSFSDYGSRPVLISDIGQLIVFKEKSTSHRFSAFRALQDENADLHQNLLQTVVCIESLEVELQRTRDELSHVKAKYKRLARGQDKDKNTLHDGLALLI